MKVAINFIFKNEYIEEWDEVQIQEFDIDSSLSLRVYQHDTIDKAKAGIKDRLLYQLTDGINPYYYQGVSYDNDYMRYSYNTYSGVEGHVVRCLEDKFYEVYYDFCLEDDCEYADMIVKDLRLATDDDATRFEIDTDLGWISGTFVTELKDNVSEKRKAEFKPFALINKVKAAVKETTEYIDEYSRVDWNVLSAYDVEELKELAACNDLYYAREACYYMFQILNDEVSEGMFGWQQDSIAYLKGAAKKGHTEISEFLWDYLEEEFCDEFRPDFNLNGYSLDRFIATNAAEDLCCLKAGDLVYIREKYGLDTAARFVEAMKDSDPMFYWEEYIDGNDKDREVYMKMGEQHQETAGDVCFYFWWRGDNAHNLKYVEEDFYRYTAHELQLGTPLKDTFVCNACIQDSEPGDSSLIKLWQPELIKKYGLELVIPEFLAKYAEKDYWEEIVSELDNYPSFIGDLFSVLADYKDNKDVTLIMENLLFQDSFDIPSLCNLIQKYDCSELLQNILARFTEGDIWSQFEYGIDEYLYFLERLFEIIEEDRGYEGLVDFLEGLIPLIRENIDSSEATEIINALFEVDLPDDSEVRKFLDEVNE